MLYSVVTLCTILLLGNVLGKMHKISMTLYLYHQAYNMIDIVRLCFLGSCFHLRMTNDIDGHAVSNKLFIQRYKYSLTMSYTHMHVPIYTYSLRQS